VLGSLMAAHLALFPLDDDVRDVAVDMRGSASNRAADMLRPLGRTSELAAAGAATYLVGLAISNRRVADFGLHAFVTLALSNALTGGLKAVTGRARPLTHQADGSWARNEANHWDFFGGWGTAYPSGHTSNAFALATVFAEELGGAAGWVAYPIAAGVAWSRLNDEAHWASDVVLGAAVGIVTGQLVVRHGHRSGGWLERSLLVERSSSLAAVDIGLRIPSR
jgi:membrane-associated phospholipid phosphatase